MKELSELKGLVYQIQDEASKNRALQLIRNIESEFPKGNKFKKKELCSCVDWRDMSPSPFCHTCGGKGSYELL